MVLLKRDSWTLPGLIFIKTPFSNGGGFWYNCFARKLVSPRRCCVSAQRVGNTKDNVMGFLSDLFSSATPLERDLIANYTAFFESLGMSHATANRAAKGLLQEAKQMMGRHPELTTEPANFGDWLLEHETKDIKISDNLRKKREEGVRDENILWWWNQPPLSRCMIHVVDKRGLFAIFKRAIEEGKSTEMATKWVRKYDVCYGEPDMPDQTQTGEDAPLPYELKDRINIYRINRNKTDPDTFRNDCERSSSFNAIIRKEIKAGRI